MSDGTPVPGLLRRADGRWKVSTTGQTFVEPDERLAVARFRQIQQGSATPELGAIGVFTDHQDAAAAFFRRTKPGVGSVTLTVAKSGEASVVTDATLRPEQWAWLRQQIVSRPQWVAQMVGVEQIGYLDGIRKPTASPTLDEVGTLYAAKPGLSSNEAGRSKLFWKEFSKAVGVKTIRELTHEHVGSYEAAVQAGGFAPKSILHRYRKVRTILAYAIKRGRGVEDCRRALDITAMLEVKEHTPLDPKPISPADFWAIYTAAEKAEDKTFAAMLLVALNAAMYAGEVSALKWDEVDLKSGELVTRRPKTGVSRVAMLWPETLKALRALPRVNEYIFNTRVRSYTVFSALDSWRKYRTASDVSESLVFGQIRDAAFTIACRSSLDQARVLAGHRLPGASDHYIRRAPGFVADACKAIRAAYTQAKKEATR